jgi:hypothetical protein
MNREGFGSAMYENNLQEITFVGKWPKIAELIDIKGRFLKEKFGDDPKVDTYILGEDDCVIYKMLTPTTKLSPKSGQTFEDYWEDYCREIGSKANLECGDCKLKFHEDYRLERVYHNIMNLRPEIGRLEVYSEIEKKTRSLDKQLICCTDVQIDKMDIFSYNLRLWGFGFALEVVDTISAELVGYASNNSGNDLVCIYQILKNKPHVC